SCVLAGVLLMPRAALAHDPPFVYDIVWSSTPAEPTLFLTNRGFVIQSPESSELRLLCSHALQVSSTEQVDVVSSPDGAWLVGTSRGLLRSADGGCTWSGASTLGEVAIYALRRDPTRSTRLVGASGDDMPTVYLSDDSGATWQPGYQLPMGMYFEELHYARGTADLLYAGGLKLDKPVLQLIAASRDGGKTFEEALPIPVEETETDTSLLDVGPGDGQQLLVKTQAGNPAVPNRLLRSGDGGKTWATVLTSVELQSARFSSDGARVFAAGHDGLWISQDSGQTFEQVPDAELMTYASEHEGELVAAGWYRGIAGGSSGVASAAISGEQVERRFDFEEIQAPVACASDSMTTGLCAELWLDWMREFPPPGSAGSAGSAGTAGVVSATAGAVAAADAGAAGAAGSSSVAGAAATSGSAGAQATPPAAPASAAGGCAVASERPLGLGWLVSFGAAGIWRAYARRRVFNRRRKTAAASG
ncbi:MAG: hypothetical protein ABW321_26895, partial [Polyangiales bacterium]